MRFSVRPMARSALMTAVMCILSPFSVPLGVTAATLQTFAAALTGYLLRPQEAFWALAAYLLLGACGLPVFSAFSGGVGVLTGPTGGFLWAFPWMALLCAMSRRKSTWMQAAAGFAGLLVVYSIGTLQLSLVTGMSVREAFLAGSVPFIPKDVLSAAAACAAGRTIGRRIRLLY